MVWIEFFKTHKNALRVGFCIFLGCLLVIAFIILAHLLWMGLMASLSFAVFLSGLWGLLLASSMMVAVLWWGLNHLMDAVHQWYEPSKASLSTPLTAEDGVTQGLQDCPVPPDHLNHSATRLTEEHRNPSDIKLSPESECVECYQETRNLTKFNGNTSNQKDVHLNQSMAKNIRNLKVEADLHLGFFSSKKSVDEQSGQTFFGSYFNLHLLINTQDHSNSNHKIIPKT